MMITFVAALVTLVGCTSVRQEVRKNYTTNIRQQAIVGAVMLSRCNEIMLYPRGLARMFRQPKLRAGSFKEELIYTGVSGKSISVSYREYKDDFARPAFYQELRYDLDQSSAIVFRNYRLVVHEATNEAISYTVLVD